jgi:hypothetical protein
MRTIIAKEGQTLFDIAVQGMGDAESAYEIGRLNSISVTTGLVSGQVLMLPDQATDADVLREFEIRKYVPATNDIGTDDVGLGIEFWGIEIDFVVQ